MNPAGSGVLYIVSTPIGNMKDITLRALEILGGADAIACEDTRETHKLLAHHAIRVPMVSYHDHSGQGRLQGLVERLKEGAVIALVTDNGTPLVSDPGFTLVREALQNGVRVEPVPGPSAVVAALSAAGVPADRFAFAGFLPVKPGRRISSLMALRELEMTVVCYESPHRLLASLEAVAAVFGLNILFKTKLP